MTYQIFNGALPNGGSPSNQNGAAFGQSARDNLNALRDACILGGGFPGFNLSISGGVTGQPATLLYSGIGGSTERVKAALTWGTTGGQAGNVTQTVYSYSNDSGSTYVTIKTIDVTYDGSGNVTSTTWS